MYISSRTPTTGNILVSAKHLRQYEMEQFCVVLHSSSLRQKVHSACRLVYIRDSASTPFLVGDVSIRSFWLRTPETTGLLVEKTRSHNTGGLLWWWEKATASFHTSRPQGSCNTLGGLRGSVCMCVSVYCVTVVLPLLENHVRVNCQSTWGGWPVAAGHNSRVSFVYKVAVTPY